MGFIGFRVCSVDRINRVLGYRIYGLRVCRVIRFRVYRYAGVAVRFM